MIKDKKIIISLVISALIFFIALLKICGTDIFNRAPGIGERVFARWEINSWYHGEISGECSNGWQIVFDDGDKKCCTPEEIIKDVIPDAKRLKKGINIIARWTDGKYYPGYIAEIKQNQYYIQFDDGDKLFVQIKHIRLMN